ncbi:MAG: hypothetical protein ACRD4J_03145 [Nitrososphaeraceae archaeon]
MMLIASQDQNGKRGQNGVNFVEFLDVSNSLKWDVKNVNIIFVNLILMIILI